MRAKVAEHGQVTIPGPLCEQLDIHPGSTLDFREEAGRLVAVKAEETDAVDEVYGILGSGRRTDELMAQLRGAP